MEKAYKKSLQMINTMNIQNVSQYKELVRNYLALNLVSLQYMSGTRNFSRIVEYANKL